MLHYLRKAAFLAILIISFNACTESATSSEEKTEINRIDSTSKAVEKTKEELEDQTKKVEESLEKLDKEFEPNK